MLEVNRVRTIPYAFVRPEVVFVGSMRDLRSRGWYNKKWDILSRTIEGIDQSEILAW